MRVNEAVEFFGDDQEYVAVVKVDYNGSTALRYWVHARLDYAVWADCQRDGSGYDRRAIEQTVGKLSALVGKDDDDLISKSQKILKAAGCKPTFLYNADNMTKFEPISSFDVIDEINASGDAVPNDRLLVTVVKSRFGVPGIAAVFEPSWVLTGYVASGAESGSEDDDYPLQKADLTKMTSFIKKLQNLRGDEKTLFNKAKEILGDSDYFPDLVEQYSTDDEGSIIFAKFLPVDVSMKKFVEFNNYVEKYANESQGSGGLSVKEKLILNKCKKKYEAFLRRI